MIKEKWGQKCAREKPQKKALNLYSIFRDPRGSLLVLQLLFKILIDTVNIEAAHAVQHNKVAHYRTVHTQDAGAEREPCLDDPRPLPSRSASASGWLVSLLTMSASTCGTST